MSQSAPVLKDPDGEAPVPSLWREKLAEVAEALRKRNFRLAHIVDVEQLDELTAARIANTIDDYECTLAPLPNETWETSVCQWLEGYWQVLVDLFTLEEGRSDLVLHVNVFEETGGFKFKVHFVYVP